MVVKLVECVFKNHLQLLNLESLAVILHAWWIALWKSRLGQWKQWTYIVNECSYHTYSRKVWWRKGWWIYSFWAFDDKKFGELTSAKRLLIVSTVVLVWWITDQICQTFSLPYFPAILYICWPNKMDVSLYTNYASFCSDSHIIFYMFC